ncbi:hypothetical protein PanWU01x14_109350 [Parasponia andersonii]|uniref:Uncharacterized protein n=1 Tax=Parasponia andersonii TaxID=3476 RepID=A0A2P5CZQ2_PARAD|nr:hypothetical protein PanWU01x14_109350 [Parasponia andersonii]
MSSDGGEGGTGIVWPLVVNCEWWRHSTMLGSASSELHWFFGILARNRWREKERRMSRPRVCS